MMVQTGGVHSKGGFVLGEGKRGPKVLVDEELLVRRPRGSIRKQYAGVGNETRCRWERLSIARVFTRYVLYYWP